MSDYTPIACGFHDRFEHHAVRGDTIEVEVAGEPPFRARIADVFARGGADWAILALENGSERTVRLDRVEALGAFRSPDAC